MTHLDHWYSTEMTTTNNNDQVPYTPDDILHPSSRKLFHHWESVRGEDSAPRKLDIDLKHLADLLPQIGILQRHPLQSVYNWRLAGSGICDIFGTEVTKSRFMDDWDDFERTVISQALDAAISGHQPCVARLRATNQHGDLTGLELLALPVSTKKANITHLLIGLFRFREPEKTEQQPLTSFDLSRLKMIWTEHAHDKVHGHHRNPPQPGIADAPARPVFRVIEGGLSV